MKYLFLAFVCASFAGCSHSNNGGGHVVGNHLVPPGSEMPADKTGCGCKQDGKDGCGCKMESSAGGDEACGCGDHHKKTEKKKKGK